MTADELERYTKFVRMQAIGEVCQSFHMWGTFKAVMSDKPNNYSGVVNFVIQEADKILQRHWDKANDELREIDERMRECAMNADGKK